MCDTCVRNMLDADVEAEIGLLGRHPCQQVVRLCDEINRLRVEAQTGEGRRPVGQSEPGKPHRHDPMQEDVQGFTIRQD